MKFDQLICTQVFINFLILSSLQQPLTARSDRSKETPRDPGALESHRDDPSISNPNTPGGDGRTTNPATARSIRSAVDEGQLII